MVGVAVPTQEPPGEPVRLLICDDYLLIREGLKAVLSREPDIQVVGEAETAERALELVDELLPDVVIMDILLPGMDGIQATRMIKQDHPSVAVVAVTRYDDIDHIMEIYRSGASAYLKKGVKGEELSSTVRAVAVGAIVLHPHVADAVIRTFDILSALPYAPARANLSVRETDVLKLVARGLSNKEIARELGISLRTAQNHIANIFRKLELSDRVSAAVFAVNQGIAKREETLLRPSSPETRPVRER